jgi:hypothetical protein
VDGSPTRRALRRSSGDPSATTTTREGMRTMSRYHPARGGHAPGHLRTMFCEYLERGEVPVDELYDPADAGDDPERWLTGQLWDCTDILPSEYCSLLALRSGSTYAMAARQKREEVVAE